MWYYFVQKYNKEAEVVSMRLLFLRSLFLVFPLLSSIPFLPPYSLVLSSFICCCLIAVVTPSVDFGWCSSLLLHGAMIPSVIHGHDILLRASCFIKNETEVIVIDVECLLSRVVLFYRM